MILLRGPSGHGKGPLLLDQETSPEALKEPHSKAFGAWSGCFCEAHPVIKELEMLPPCGVVGKTIENCAILREVLSISAEARTIEHGRNSGVQLIQMK